MLDVLITTELLDCRLFYRELNIYNLNKITYLLPYKTILLHGQQSIKISLIQISGFIEPFVNNPTKNTVKLLVH